MSVVRIGVLQFARNSNDLQGNADRMLKQVAECQGADIILLPEDWLGPVVVQEAYYLDLLVKLQNLCSQGGFCLLTGAQYIASVDTEAVVNTEPVVNTDQASGRIYSRGAVLHPTEGILGWVEKLFPSGAVEERRFLQPGQQSPVFQYKGVKFGIVVCVDIMYPEVVRDLALRGAEIIYNPANIVARRSLLWEKVGSARAAENTVFVVMANNTGTAYQDGSPVEGHSFVAGPDGTTLAAWGSTPGFHCRKIDLRDIAVIRERWKYLADVGEDPKNIFARFYTHN